MTAPTGSRSTSDDDFPDIDARNSPPQTLRDHLLWQMQMSHFRDTDRRIAARADRRHQRGRLPQLQAGGDPAGLEQELAGGDRRDRGGVAPDPELRSRSASARATSRMPASADEGAPPRHAVSRRRRRKSPPRKTWRCWPAAITPSCDASSNSRPKTCSRRSSSSRHLNPRPAAIPSPHRRPATSSPISSSRRSAACGAPISTPDVSPASAHQSPVRKNDPPRRSQRRQPIPAGPAAAGALVHQEPEVSRNETLLKVARAIVDRQRAFFDHGAEAMKPLVLHDIAETVEHARIDHLARDHQQIHAHPARHIRAEIFLFQPRLARRTAAPVRPPRSARLSRSWWRRKSRRKPISDSTIAEILCRAGHSCRAPHCREIPRGDEHPAFQPAKVPSLNQLLGSCHANQGQRSSSGNHRTPARLCLRENRAHPETLRPRHQHQRRAARRKEEEPAQAPRPPSTRQGTHPARQRRRTPTCMPRSTRSPPNSTGRCSGTEGKPPTITAAKNRSRNSKRPEARLAGLACVHPSTPRHGTCAHPSPRQETRHTSEPGPDGRTAKRIDPFSALCPRNRNWRGLPAPRPARRTCPVLRRVYRPVPRHG